jgi:hypothetical protein
MVANCARKHGSPRDHAYSKGSLPDYLLIIFTYLKPKTSTMTTVYINIRSQEYVDISGAHPGLEVDGSDLGLVHSKNKTITRKATMLTARSSYDIHEQAVKFEKED